MTRHMLATAFILIAAPALAEPAPQPPVMFLTPAPASDSCMSEELAYLIGLEAAQVENLSSLGRIGYPTSVWAMNHMPHRRNIFVDTDGIITQVTCG